MRRLLLMILLLTFAFGVGCASPYQPEGLGGGYTETQLAPDVFRVSFRGNGYTERDRVQDFAMLRAAEITLEHGYKYFSIVDEADSESVSTFTTPGSAHSTGTMYLYGNQGMYTESTTYTPSQTYRVSNLHTSLMIHCLTEEAEDGYALDAKFVTDSLRAKYKIEQPQQKLND